MKTRTSKLTRVLVATMFFAAAVTIASSQEKQAGSQRREENPNVVAAKGEAISNQERYRDLEQPEDTIRVEVRYPTAYGYKYATGLFDPGPNSCDGFTPSVDVGPATASRRRESRQPELFGISKEPKMRESNGVYVCDYLISYLPLDQPINVRVGVGSAREASTEAWMGGNDAQPPKGQRRTIKYATRTVMLTANQRRASLTFEMIYSSIPYESAIATPVATEAGGGTSEALRARMTPKEPPICTNARSARARNSPAAPGLEAQCRAAGGTLPDPPICTSARSARARNSPAAPGLEARCRAAGGIL